MNSEAQKQAATMTPRPEDAEQFVTDTEVETNDPVEDVKATEAKDPEDTAEDPTPSDEVEVCEEEKETSEDAKEEESKEEEETTVQAEESKPKTAEEIRQSFDPFFNSSEGEDAADKIAKESADAAKELASLFS